MNRYIIRDWVWKTGVVLSRETAWAEVIEEYQNNRIHIRLVGENKKPLLAVIMHELDEIHATFSRLQVDRLIPCNCPTCKAAKEPYFFRYEVLQKSLTATDMVQCQSSFEMVDTRRLLDDVLPGRYDHDETNGE
jgi:internalin A